MVIAQGLVQRQALFRRHHQAGFGKPIGGDPGAVERQRRRHGKIGMQGHGDAMAGECPEPGHLARPLITDDMLPIGVAQLIDVIDIDRRQSAEIGHAADLFRGRNTEMLDGEAVIEAWPLPLQFLQDVERQFDAEIG